MFIPFLLQEGIITDFDTSTSHEKLETTGDYDSGLQTLEAAPIF